MITYFNGNHHETCQKYRKDSQENIIDNILVSKSAGTKTAFHTIDFHPRGIFCWSFKTKAVSRDIICKQLLGKHSCQSVILTILKSHFLLIVVFLWICLLLLGLCLLFICSDDDIYLFSVLIYFNNINWFNKQSSQLEMF